jgi:GNAT superfamily N-acetyltransferase
MPIKIDLLKEHEIEAFSHLVDFVFDEYVGKDYAESGNKTFKEYTNPEAIVKRMHDNSTFYIAKDEGWIIGALEVRDKNHISLFFVDKEYQGKGIGSALFKRYTSDIASLGIAEVSVNSSVFGENIYAALGFKRSGSLQEKDGILFIPMIYTLGSAISNTSSKRVTG